MRRLDLRPRPLAALSTASRQRAVLSNIADRPWPLPRRRYFMGQSWLRLLFAHWEVDRDALRQVVPPQLALDLYEGRAFVGVSPFQVEGFRLRGLPPPPVISRFREVNVRTYVEYAGKPGIYFLSLDASSGFAVRGARRTYRLPYFRSRISLEQGDVEVRVRLVRVSRDGPPAELDCRYRPSGERFRAKPGSLDYFLTERYCLYTLAEGGTVQRGEIHHPPWPLQPATAEIALNTMDSAYPFELRGEPLLHFATRQDVVLWAIEPA